MPNVRDVFERAYGPVPDGATCHSAWGCELDAPDAPDYGPGLRLPLTDVQLFWDGYAWADNEDGLYGPDISDRDAEAFRGFFGDDYDAALDALTKEESEDSIHPDEIIKIANALAKFVSQGGDTEWAKDMAGYYLAASGIYERVSADGTGESPVLSTHLDVMGELYEQDETENTIDDGFGNAWGKCRPDCGMYVVRPGKAACGYEGTTSCGFYPGDDVMGEGK